MSAVKTPVNGHAGPPHLLTDHLAGLIDPDDPDDPVARQFVFDPREVEATAAERGDPIGDAAHSPLPGIVHRYRDRVLLTPVMTCPAYCRFCFRREAVGEGALGEDALEDALAYIRDREEIWEVILSGGDPLILSPRRLSRILAALDAIPHVETIRIHSRVPVADPERITGALVAALDVDTPVWVVLHCNHARELVPEARAACARLVRAGIPMLSQTVLLRGVNDDAATLDVLFRALVRCRVKPYYLHHADLARGTGHFRTTLAEGRALAAALRGSLSGLALPTYVLDIPGGHGKVPAGPCYLEPDGSPGGWIVRDPAGNPHAYRDDA